jgi:hypothetical protein
MITSCSDNKQGDHLSNSLIDDNVEDEIIVEEDLGQDINDSDGDISEVVDETTTEKYCDNISKLDSEWCDCNPNCCQVQYWFCIPEFGNPSYYKKDVIVDVCDDNKNACVYGQDDDCPPPEIIYEGDCTEAYECEPGAVNMDLGWQLCELPDGTLGKQKVICDKGKLFHSPCKPCDTEICDGLDNDCDDKIDEELEIDVCNTLCGQGDLICIQGEEICYAPQPEIEVCNGIDDDCDGEIDEGLLNACGDCGDTPEEVCDYIDNDCDGVIDNGVANACGACGKVPEEICNGLDDNCDGTIDEGQLNACGKCGPVDDEICDGIDNDCNGLTDEDLIGECTTDCETNLKYCVGGSWICTAKQPKPEVCNGLDDDCDGKADEGLDCLCTVQDIGALFPCQESPLVCGAGYKTCECVDPNDPTCAELQLTECLAVCHWLPQTLTPGMSCDKYLGEIKPEECNNHDDNCNQQIDENLFAGCYSGLPETMFVGVCVPGEMTCFEGKWGNYDDNNQFIKKLCLGETIPEPEDLCNGTDTNCDGEIDEDKELEPTDILFIVDLSGSMYEEINAVMVALNKFAAYYSDSDVIKWGLVFTASIAQGNVWGEQVVLKTDLVDFQSFMNVFQNSGFVLNGGDEQNYDAIYLAIHNLVGALFLPYTLTDLQWSNNGFGGSTTESVPPKEQWNISWRDDAKHVIILFSDEQGQTYLTPQITESILVNMINAADELAVYAFTQQFLLDFGSADNYEALAAAGIGGKVYPLTMKAIEMYNNLLEILDETACNNKNNPAP